MTPPWRSLSRVISRITDSVNCVAFFEPLSLDMCADVLSTTEVTEDAGAGSCKVCSSVSFVSSVLIRWMR